MRSATSLQFPHRKYVLVFTIYDRDRICNMLWMILAHRLEPPHIHKLSNISSCGNKPIPGLNIFDSRFSLPYRCWPCVPDLCLHHRCNFIWHGLLVCASIELSQPLFDIIHGYLITLSSSPNPATPPDPIPSLKPSQSLHLSSNKRHTSIHGTKLITLPTLPNPRPPARARGRHGIGTGEP